MSYGVYDPEEVNQAQAARNQTQQTKYMFGDPNNRGSGLSQHDLFAQGQAREAQANQMEMAKMPLEYQQSRFNTLFPWLQSQFGAGAANYNVGGASGTGPTISAAPIWNPHQIQQQVNASHATNDQTMASRTKAMNADVAGRGFGGNSAISKAMASQFGFQNLIANQNADRDIRWNAAEGNAKQRLQGQTAREQQYANRMGEDIERRKTFQSSQNALLGALAGML